MPHGGTTMKTYILPSNKSWQQGGGGLRPYVEVFRYLNFWVIPYLNKFFIINFLSDSKLNYFIILYSIKKKWTKKLFRRLGIIMTVFAMFVLVFYVLKNVPLIIKNAWQDSE